MSRTRRFLDGVSFSYANQFAIMALGLWLTPFLLRHLGQHDYGLWLIGLQTLNYLALFDIGVVGLLPREVAFAKGRINGGASEDELRNLVQDTLVVVLWQTLLVAGAAAVVWFGIPSRGRMFDSTVHLVVAVFVLQFPLRVFYAALEGLQDFAFLGYLQFVAWAVGVAANVVLVFLGNGLYALGEGWAVTQALLAAGTIWRMYRHFSRLSPRRLRWLGWDEIRTQITSGFWVSVGQIAQILLNGSDDLLVGKLLGVSAVVPFACSKKLAGALKNQPQMIMQVAAPGLSELRFSPEKDRIGSVVGSLSQAMLMFSGLISCVVLAVNQGFVIRWVGREQNLGFWFAVFLVVSILFRHWNTTVVYSLFCFGQQRHISIITILDGAGTVASTWVLISLFGPLGVLLGSLVGVLVFSLPSNLWALRRETGIPLRILLAPLGKWLPPCVVALAICGLGGWFYTPATYFGCAVVSIMATVLYVGLEWKTARESHWGSYLSDMITPGAKRIRDRFRRREARVHTMSNGEDSTE